VLEATGGLKRLVTAALALAGLRVAVVNPRQVRDFAKATGRLAKTDTIDAAVLAHFAQALQPTPHPLPDTASQALTALVERRHQLVSRLTAEQNRLQQALPAVRAQIAAHIAWLKQALAEVDGDLDQFLRASPIWRERDRLQRSVPGVGPAVSRTLLAHLPELGEGSVKHLATLLGLAPLNRDSGAWRGSCAIWGGRQPVRIVVHGHPGRRTSQPYLTGILRTVGDARETKEGGVNCLHAHVAHDPACCAARPRPLGTWTCSCAHLTVKTIAATAVL
jgi:transposase